MTVEEASVYLKLIADPNRLTILRMLTKKLHVSANEFLPSVKCKQATLSHHLSELVNSGLLNSKKKGNKVFYSLNAVKYEQLVNSLDKIDRINKTETPKHEVKKVEIKKIEKPVVEEKPITPEKPVEKKPEEQPIRVVETPVIEKRPVKVSLPTYLL